MFKLLLNTCLFIPLMIHILFKGIDDDDLSGHVVGKFITRLSYGINEYLD